MAGAVLSGAIAAVDFDAAKAELRRAVEDFLTQLFAKAPDTDVARAAGYAVLGSGHRWRALVAVAAGKIFRDDSLRLVLPAACGVELAHGASLVLDDLPSMDDAAIRRGKALHASRLSGLGGRHDACVPGDARLSDQPRHPLGAEADWLRQLVTEASWKSS
jgi:geranylgeranyl pyrophosphate synthase